MSYANVGFSNEYFLDSPFEDEWNNLGGMKVWYLSEATKAIDLRYGHCYKNAICEQSQLPELQPRCPEYVASNGEIVVGGDIPAVFSNVCCDWALFLSRVDSRHEQEEAVGRDKYLKSQSFTENEISSHSQSWDIDREASDRETDFSAWDAALYPYLIAGCTPGKMPRAGFSQSTVCSGVAPACVPSCEDECE